MREIKFRGKRIDNGEWVYGFYSFQTEGGWDIDSSTKQHLICTGENEQYYNGDSCAVFYAPKAFIIDPDTVGQFTGLLDKNGAEIYEGDILDVWLFITEFDEAEGQYEAEKNFKAEIRFDELGLCFDVDNKTYSFYLANEVGMNMDFSESLKVIGNIYDNPELLK